MCNGPLLMVQLHEQFRLKYILCMYASQLSNKKTINKTKMQEKNNLLILKEKSPSLMKYIDCFCC